MNIFRIMVLITGLILASSSANAFFNTTFGGVGNDPSTNSADYILCAGDRPGMADTNCQGFDSANFEVQTQGDGVVSRSATEVNITSRTDGAGDNYIRTVANIGPIGTCMDVQVIHYDGQGTDISALTGYDDDGTFTGSETDDVSFMTVRNQNPDNQLLLRVGDSWTTFSSTVPQIQTNEWSNLTVCINSTTQGTYYVNNSATGSEDVTSTTNIDENTRWIFEVNTDTSPGGAFKFGMRWMAIYNISGVEQQTTNTLEIKSPTTASPQTVSTGDNFSITMNISDGTSEITTGVTVINATVGGTLANILPGPDVESVTEIYSTSFETTTSEPFTLGQDFDYAEQNARTGTESLHVDGVASNDLATYDNTHDLTSYDECTLEVYMNADTNLDAGEYICMDWSNNSGTNWDATNSGSKCVGADYGNNDGFYHGFFL